MKILIIDDECDQASVNTADVANEEATQAAVDAAVKAIEKATKAVLCIQ